MATQVQIGDTLSYKRRWYKSLAFREAMWGYIFTVPVFLIFFIGLVGLPILFTFYLTFFNWDGLSPLANMKFIGLWHYGRIIRGMLNILPFDLFNLADADTRAAEAFWHAANFTIGSLIGQLSLGLAMALVVHQARRGVGFMRLIFFMPVVLPGVAINLLFATILYQPLWGLLNQLFTYLNVPLSFQNFLGGPGWLLDPGTAMRSIITMQVWQWAGYYMILYLAGLQSIPETYYDAAKVDGANAFQRFWHITLPLLRPTIALTVVVNIIGSMQVFTPVQLMTQGGPARATEVTVLLIFNTTFGYFKYSYGATMAFILFLIILVLSLLQLRLLRAGESIL
jgi:ABC-type sugar transport system permease subunit